jgi:hypothetical protein
MNLSLIIKWTSHCLQSLLLFLFTLILYLLLFRNFQTQFDIDNARYLISTIIQSQAAIIAIVVSISLISVQIAMSQYSQNVSRVFLRNPLLWITLTIYSILIIFGLFVLENLNYVEYFISGQDFSLSRKYISNIPLIYGISILELVYFEFMCTIFSILSLFPFLYRNIMLLDPKNFVNMIIWDDNNSQNSASYDIIIQPVSDILYKSIDKNDKDIFYFTIKSVSDRFFTKKICDCCLFEKSNCKKFVELLEQLLLYGLRNKNEEIIKPIVDSLFFLEGESLSKKCTNLFENTASILCKSIDVAEKEKLFHYLNFLLKKIDSFSPIIFSDELGKENHHLIMSKVLQIVSDLGFKIIKSEQQDLLVDVHFLLEKYSEFSVVPQIKAGVTAAIYNSNNI